LLLVTFRAGDGAAGRHARAYLAAADLEDAARTSGAGLGHVFIRVVLPLMSAALLSCRLFGFLLAVQNVALPLMPVGPGPRSWRRPRSTCGRMGRWLAAMGVLWVALVLVVSAGFHFDV